MAMATMAMATMANGNAIFLKRSTGEKIKDAIIIPSLLQTMFNLYAIFESLSSTPKADNAADIPMDEHGMQAIMVDGKHPALHYRGNALRRGKIWGQTEYDRGFKKYGYTGWQHAISNATRDVAAFPAMDMLLSWLNDSFADILAKYGLPACDAVFNHVIFTRYEDENDFIGMHSDKEKDFVKGSYFVIIKLGSAREFLFTEGDEEKEIFRQELSTGTMIIVKTGTESANQTLKHGVPVMKNKCGPSGSLVFRAIQTTVPWKEVQKNIAKSKVAKQKRKQRKQRKDLNKKMKQSTGSSAAAAISLVSDSDSE